VKWRILSSETQTDDDPNLPPRLLLPIGLIIQSPTTQSDVVVTRTTSAKFASSLPPPPHFLDEEAVYKETLNERDMKLQRQKKKTMMFR
jgi:hypothetical protein